MGLAASKWLGVFNAQGVFGLVGLAAPPRIDISQLRLDVARVPG